MAAAFPELRDVTVSLNSIYLSRSGMILEDFWGYLPEREVLNSKLIIGRRWYLFLLSFWNREDSLRKFLHFLY